MEPRPSSLVLANDQVILAQCEEVVMARIGEPPRSGKWPDTTEPEGHRDVPVRILIATRRYQKFTKGSLLAHCEPVTLVTSPDVEQPQVRDTTPKLQDVIAAIRPNLSDAGSQVLEELTEHGDIFAMESDTYGRGPTDSPTPRGGFL
jgi:hypothetical protein